MRKAFCDKCGTECKENVLTEVAIPVEKTRFHSFTTKRLMVCSDCEKEYHNIIDTWIDIYFLMFEKFYQTSNQPCTNLEEVEQMRRADDE